jgi:hypothetical protein
MTKDEAKPAILAEWAALPPEQRREDHQAAEFACASRIVSLFGRVAIAYQVIKGWLLNNLSRN